MTVLLNRAYGGFPAGAIVQLAAELEVALIAQNIASNSAAALTPGAQSNLLGSDFALIGISGSVAIPAAAASVVVANPRITAGSKVFATVSQTAADGTLTNIVRVAIVPTTVVGGVTLPGTVTIFGNAAATAQVQVSYLIVA
jgi:hypothetical protein